MIKMSFLRVVSRCSRLATSSIRFSRLPMVYQPALNFSPVTTHQFSHSVFRNFSDTNSAHVFAIEDEEDFDERVVNSDVPVLVDFYADWCGPCKNLGARLECKVEAQQGKILLAKINVDCAGELPDEYEVNSVPTVIAFKDGHVFYRFEGDVEDSEIDQLMAKLMLDDMEGVGRSDD